MMKKIFLPLFVLSVFGGIAFLVVQSKEAPPKREIEKPLPVVACFRVSPKTVTLSVTSRGSVQPGRLTRLAAEVSGEVVAVSPNLREGAFFEKGAVLLRLDPSDYEAVLAQREAEVASARLQWEQEKANAAQARKDWERIGDGNPSELTLRVPQLASAKARFRAAEKALVKAQQDLERTRVKAPFRGRVKSRYVEIGDYITAPGVRVADVYGLNYFEVSLPVTLKELSRLSLDDRGLPAETQISLESKTSGARHRWNAYLHRSEGVIDERNRLLNLIARIPEPFDGAGERALRVGQFVEARILGKRVAGVFEIPSEVFEDRETLFVVADKEGQAVLRRRKVEILQFLPGRNYVKSGLQPGDRVVLSPVNFGTPDMPVEVKEVSAP